MTAVALTRTGAVSSGTLENDAPMAKSAAPADVERLSRMMRDGFDPIWRLLRRLGVSADAADDAAQEVFMVAARRIHEIEAGSEQSYLYGTALRVAKSHHRRQASSSARHVPLDESRLSASTSPEQALDQRQRLALLDDALGVLDFYLAHRRDRLDQVERALAELSVPISLGLAEDDTLPRQVVEVVYADVDEVLWDAAELSVRAQLFYLAHR